MTVKVNREKRASWRVYINSRSTQAYRCVCAGVFCLALIGWSQMHQKQPDKGNTKQQ